MARPFRDGEPGDPQRIRPGPRSIAVVEIPASLPAGETPASLPAWPDGARVAVALTFDVDAEAPWLGEGPEYASRLTMLSQARYGPARGLGRILDLLAVAGLSGDLLRARPYRRPLPGRGRGHP